MLSFDECDFNDSNFGVDDNNEMFADRKLEKEKVQNFLFETKQVVVE